ncbi:ATP-binding protein, partial [Bacteroides eggerthii]
MEQMRKLPIGIQTFEEIRKENYLYVDKTAMVYQLANVGKPYFLSRPRRFGKSLLISTFEAYFQGRKDLFEGLAIEKLETEWKEYPVLHLDLNAKKYETSDDLTAMLNQYLEKWEQKYGNEKRNRSSEERFAYIIEQAYIQTGKQVVVLIDEYDKPLLQAILDESLLEEYRRTLKAFYGVLKSADRYLRFVFLTGVTKFAQVSVFSDLNQLNDISMDYAYNSLCGITKEELSSNFVPEIKNLGEFLGLTFEEIVDRLEKQYDGYHFCEDTTVGLFNPFSVLNALQKLKLGNYWFQTGTPTYLVDLLKQSDYDLRLLINGIETTNSAFSEYRAEANNPLPMIYQSGYLTIKHYDKEVDLYTLKFPNDEVCYGFLNFLVPYYTNVSDDETGFHIAKFIRELRSGDIEAFMERLKVFFAGMPYELSENTERHYQAIFYVVFTL